MRLSEYSRNAPTEQHTHARTLYIYILDARSVPSGKLIPVRHPGSISTRIEPGRAALHRAGLPLRYALVRLVGFSTPRDETTASGPQVSQSGHASSSSLSSIRKKKLQPLTVNACYAGLFLALLFGSSRFWLCFGKIFCSRRHIGCLIGCRKRFPDIN